MTDWLSKPLDAAKSVLNVIRSVGPFLISQSDSISEAWARHKTRVAAVDIGKELLHEEVQVLTGAQKKLFDRLIDAEPEERIRLRRELEEIQASLRQLKIGARAIELLPAPSPQPSQEAPPNELPQSEVSAHWMDKFSELARAHNEPWREELLARALATESASPGTVSPRALWLLGTLEERMFNAFATLLDLSMVLAGGFVIPRIGDYESRAIPDCSLGGYVTIGHLIYQLGDVGLVADALTTQRNCPKGMNYRVAYRGTSLILRCVGGDLQVEGTMLTPLGESVASFYEPKYNPLGEEIFNAWLESLDKTQFPVIKAP